MHVAQLLEIRSAYSTLEYPKYSYSQVSQHSTTCDQIYQQKICFRDAWSASHDASSLSCVNESGCVRGTLGLVFAIDHQI